MHPIRKVSLFVNRLESNPIVRAAPFARAIEALGMEVEVLGLLRPGMEIYKPYRTAFEYKTEPASMRITSVIPAARRLAARADGEVMYAFKPLWGTLGAAWLAARRAGNQLFLDVEDDDVFGYTGLRPRLLLDGAIKAKLFADAFVWAAPLHPVARKAAFVSVSSERLRRRYGGIIALHGPDELAYDPARFDGCRGALRAAFRLPQHAFLLLFAGMPVRHKGLDTVVEALRLPGMEQAHLVLAGDPARPEFAEAVAELGPRCHLLGLVANAQMPQLLAACDLVPVVQRRNNFTEAQIPAKMLEAMAMARPVIASNVGDLPRIVADGTSTARGWLVEPDSPAQLYEVVARAMRDLADVKQRGNNARRFFVDNASKAALMRVLKPALVNQIHG